MQILIDQIIYLAKVNIGVHADVDNAVRAELWIEEVFAASEQRACRPQKLEAGREVRLREARHRHRQKPQNWLHRVAILKSNRPTIKARLVDDLGVSSDQIIVRIFFRVQISIAGILVHLNQKLANLEQTLEDLAANFDFSEIQNR